MKKISKVIILGGGSSGWMTAASLAKNFPELDLTLIEASDIPTIGVGESTIGSINIYLRNLGLKDQDWMPFCNATYKASIDFENWDGIGTRFHYPFGRPSFCDKIKNFNQWFDVKAFSPICLEQALQKRISIR